MVVFLLIEVKFGDILCILEVYILNGLDFNWWVPI